MMSEMPEFIYAQGKAGQKLHLVRKNPDSTVGWRGLCGRTAPNGHWRLTINLPMGMNCKACHAQYRRVYGKKYWPKFGLSVSIG